MKHLLFALLFFSSLYANKVIYLTYEKVPNRVIKGEIFPVTIKALSTLKESQDIHYNFTRGYGLKLLNTAPLREKRGKYFYDTFNFLTINKNARLPDIEASLVGFSQEGTTSLGGKALNVIALNPPKNFSNIVAKRFELVEYKTTSYDNEHNIIIFVATALNTNIRAMRFSNVYKQGAESVTESFSTPRVTYFVVVDKAVENFTFTYFNTEKNKFSLVNIPIVVLEDSVVTQSDLKPKDQSHETIKIIAAAALTLMIFLFALARKRYTYFILMIAPLAYIGYIAFPDKVVCINSGAKIQLLPVANGTIFETTTQVLRLQKEGASLNFTKVKLQNDKIGWVKNEDLCTY